MCKNDIRTMAHVYITNLDWTDQRVSRSIRSLANIIHYHIIKFLSLLLLLVTIKCIELKCICNPIYMWCRISDIIYHAREKKIFRNQSLKSILKKSVLTDVTNRDLEVFCTLTDSILDIINNAGLNNTKVSHINVFWLSFSYKCRNLKMFIELKILYNPVEYCCEIIIMYLLLVFVKKEIMLQLNVKNEA